MSSQKDRHIEAEKLRADGLSWTEVSDELGVSRSTVWRWRKAGKVSDPASSNGTSDVATRNGGGAADAETPSLSESRARKESALAEKHEQDAAVRRGELMERSKHRHTLFVVRRAIEGAPKACLRDVAEIMGAEPREVFPVLERISETIRDQVYGEVEAWIQEEAPDDLEE